MRQEAERKVVMFRKEAVNLLWADDVAEGTDNPKESAGTLIKRISEFSNIVGYNVTTAKSTERLSIGLNYMKLPL